MLRLILALWWGLVIYWLLSAGLNAQLPQNKNHPTSNALARWPRQVKGFGLDEAAARKDALKQAHKELIALLRQEGMLWFQPTLVYVENNLAAGPGHDSGSIHLNQLGEAKTWTLPLKTPTVHELRRLDLLAAKQVEKEEQQARSEQRIMLFTRILASVLILAAMVFGYIWLDEWRLGRYTRWLPLSGVILLGGVSIGFLWLGC